MNTCREYARSLINNLSLLSGLVLVPTEAQIKDMCRHLSGLSNKGFALDEQHMRLLISGSDRLNTDPDFQSLKRLIVQVKVLRDKKDRA